MVQKVVEKVSNDADEVPDLLLGVQLKLTGKCMRSRDESV